VVVYIYIYTADTIRICIISYVHYIMSHYGMISCYICIYKNKACLRTTKMNDEYINKFFIIVVKFHNY
jgi:hypothetical protein